MKTPSSSRKGVVLIMTFLVLTLLVVLMFQFSYSTKMDERIAKNYQMDQQNFFSIRSGFNLARALLEVDGKSTKVDTLKETWAKKEKLAGLTINGASLDMELVDAERFININLLAKKKWQGVILEQLKRLMKALGLREDLALAIQDYIDEDKEGKYELNSKNAPLDDLKELANIKELDSKTLYGDSTYQPPRPGLVQFFTLLSAGPININTAPKEVLMALHKDIDAEKADLIISQRENKDFEKVDDLTQIEGLKDLFKESAQSAGTSGDGTGSNPAGTGIGTGTGTGTEDDKPPIFKEQVVVLSQYFRVTITSRQGNMARKAEGLFKKDKDSVKLLYWKGQ